VMVGDLHNQCPFKTSRAKAPKVNSCAYLL
jgi:hypothetical protein